MILILVCLFVLDVWVLRGFQNRRGCPKAAHQFKVFQYTEGEFYAVIATSAVNNNTEIFQFSAVRSIFQLARVQVKLF